MNATTTNLGIRGRQDRRLRSRCCLVGVLLVGIALVLDPAAAPARQRAKPKPCTVHFVMANFDLRHPADPERLLWDWATDRQMSWWRKHGQKKFPHLCITSNASDADYIIAWSVADYTYLTTRTVVDSTQAPAVTGSTTDCRVSGNSIRCTTQPGTGAGVGYGVLGAIGQMGAQYAQTSRQVPAIGTGVMGVALVVDTRTRSLVRYEPRSGSDSAKLSRDVFKRAVKFIAQAESAK